MGTWKLEVGKMVMYTSFPVILFHIFNQPEYFEHWVTNVKRQIYPPDNPLLKEEMQNTIKEMRKKHHESQLAAMQEKK